MSRCGLLWGFPSVGGATLSTGGKESAREDAVLLAGAAELAALGALDAGREEARVFTRVLTAAPLLFTGVWERGALLRARAGAEGARAGACAEVTGCLGLADALDAVCAEGCCPCGAPWLAVPPAASEGSAQAMQRHTASKHAQKALRGRRVQRPKCSF